MKTTTLTPTFWLGLFVVALGAAAQEAPAPAASPETPSAPAAPAAGLRFNFRGAPLEMVLNYMSEAAGFTIVLETPVRGTVDMWSSQPLSKPEALQLLDIALNKAGYAATVQGRNLIIASKEEARKRNLPIRTGNDPREIPATADMVVQIVPLRHIDATKVATDLMSLIPTSATLTANQDSNSLVITDTQINVRHIVELVAALDSSVESVSAMRVFILKNSDPVEMANLLTNLFQAPTRGTTGGRGAVGPGNLPFGAAALFGGAFPGFGGTAGGRSGRGSSSSSGAAQAQSRAQTPVVAVADARTSSVIVTAGKETMPQIAEIIEQLDASKARQQKVFVYTLENAGTREVETALRNIFNSSSRNSNTAARADALSNRSSTTTGTQQSGGLSRTNSGSSSRSTR